jgi:hypothetical protein
MYAMCIRKYWVREKINLDTLADLHVLSFLKYLDFLRGDFHLSADLNRSLYLQKHGAFKRVPPRKEQSRNFLEEAPDILNKLQFTF